ncbi:tudor domain-containing protein 6 isoform X2 [Morone saxatilis]|uniref:tudor domain-containing protein 6 isoform X2 n=1 Tax=Morone saxatilis TaxID=34816 RepID=UPI0015E1C0C2|nr:tudor domain-containing protein 6 isoform X2 [Morone saxatilis]
MRGDKSWVDGTHETAKMSSILGLPTRGSDVTIVITKVHLHPLCELVEFWGKFSQERTAEYECLAKDIQSPGNTFQEFEGNPGDQCLVLIDGTWYRSRIVSRSGSKYSVFLIDKGMTYGTTKSKLAWGKKNHFHLPPEVEFCVLANVLPLSPENRWSPLALEFLKSLSGKSVKAHVQDVLVPHRTFLLHIPCISKQLYEMGIAKKLSPDMFQDFVLKSLQSHSEAEVRSETLQISVGAGERLRKQELFMYPELPAGTVETVIVTDVTNPQRIFCQLKVFSQELKKLSEQITQCCEGRMTNCIVGPEMIGYPCAARGSDGRWCRSVLQQVFPTSKVVEVLNVDYGTKQFVQVENIRPLAAEFFRMPVVTYICSLHGIIDKGVGWTTSQIDYLRSLLLYKTVIAKFEYQSVSEGVHYVTLYGSENMNINNLFGSKENCSLECEKTLGDYAIRNSAYSRQHPASHEINQRSKISAPGPAVEEKEGKGKVLKLPAEDLSLNSSHKAVVQHVCDPSEFWIQTQNYANELDEMMDSIYHLYKDSVNNDGLRNPTVGLYCAAKAEDGDFYRATVAEVADARIKVFFVDYGNTEVVDGSNIRTLPDEFKKLPCLALKCSLAGVRPKDGKWSQSACDFFIKAVTDKTVNVNVTAKYDEGYVVQLTCPEVQGERDIATLMCSSGLAERAETQRQPKAKMTTQPAILPPKPLPDARLSAVYKNTAGPTGNERRVPTFKEHMFPIGSILDVSVSYIESPNDFWCQLVQNTAHLKLLMHDIQAHYAGSEFQPLVETACVARHPNNAMWYRALVIHKHETPHVDVLFVDYGQMETVSLYDLRRICPQFLTLHGQAFRCSLLNPDDPTSATNEWSDEAIARFHSFVETAASNFVILKCTIYAVMYSEQRIVFNMVDLETPFESVSTSMVNLVKSAPSKKATGPSFRLDTYYYSTHNIKTGTEERVTVTCVNSVSQFYCQLERNADVIKDLKVKVSNLCRQLENVKLPTVFGTLCFAKYTDGQWYRGQIKATKPAILVQFVDYGDTIEVEKSDLLPVPREANDIMSVPVQAVMCSLSDVPDDVPSEMNSWFEKSVTECTFRALVVAREPDGKLLVELYHGKTQINSKIKKMFRIEMHTEEQVVCHGQRALETSTNRAHKTPKAVPKQVAGMEGHTQTAKENVSAPKPVLPMRDGDINQQSALKPLRLDCKDSQKVKAAPLELYRPPHQRQSCENMPSNTGNDSGPAGGRIEPKRESLPTETKPLESKSPGTESQEQSNEKLPKLADLPSKSITSGMEADVFVSHCNSPLSFYVQLAREENEIFSLVEKLNDPQSTPQTDVTDLQPDDLVQAEFEDDSSWYRAVVREINSSTMALVEFVDFGNTAMMPISKISRLPEYFLQLPMYSTHCMLSDAAALGKEGVLDPEVMSAFKEDISGNGEKVLKCQFIRQSGSMWEVRLEDKGVTVSEIAAEKLEQVEEKPADDSDVRQVPESSQKSLPNPSLHYHQQAFLEGQRFEAYVAAINDAQTFWCQAADSEELDKITSRVSEVGATADHKHIDPGSVSPGSPCIALFPDDHLWYRAEVIDKDGDELSVLFVDYGNKSQVSLTDVREMPSDLMETPPQAFLCKLEGFDDSNGYWDSGAVDELSALTVDKELQLTVARVTREEGKIKCCVLMECEGQVINEALKTWWKSSTTEKEPGAVGTNTSHFTPLLCDSTVRESAPPEDQLEYPQSQEMDTAVACRSVVETDKGTEEEGASVMDTVGPQDLNSPVDENPTEAIDESEIAKTDLETLPEEVKTYSSFDILIFSDPAEETENRKVPIARDRPLASKTTVKMVSRDAVRPRGSIDLVQIQPELALPVCVPPAVEVPTEHESEAGDGVPKEEMPCATIHVENDLMAEEETLAHHEHTYSALQADTDTAASEDADTAASEPHTCTAPSQDSGDGVEEVTCCVEEACLIDVCTDPNEQRDDGEVSVARDDCLGSRTAEEMVQNNSLLSYGDPPCEKIIALPSDTEPQAYIVPCPDLSHLVAEVTCLVGDICLTDVCRDPQEEAETEGSEQLVHTPPKQNEDFSDDVLEEDMSSFADDSFEAQLSKITHLSLIISEGSDIVCVEQQPEE